MQDEIRESLNWIFGEHKYLERYKIHRRMYVRNCRYMVMLGLSRRKFTYFKLPVGVDEKLMKAKGRELTHPKFDIFFERVSEDSVLIPDFWEAKNKAEALYRSGKLPYKLEFPYIPRKMYRLTNALMADQLN